MKAPTTRKFGCTKVWMPGNGGKWALPFPRVRMRLAPRQGCYEREEGFVNVLAVIT